MINSSIIKRKKYELKKFVSKLMSMERKSVCLGMQGTINKYQSCFSEFNHIDIECKIMNTMRSSIFPVIHLFSEFWFVLRQSYKHFPGLISHFSNTVYNQLINYLFIHHYINQSIENVSINQHLSTHRDVSRLYYHTYVCGVSRPLHV